MVPPAIQRGNLFAVEKGSGETFNIGTGIGTVTTDLYYAILALMRDSGYAKESIFDKPQKGPARPGDIRRSNLATSKATNLFGWTSENNLKAGLAKTMNWLLGAPA